MKSASDIRRPVLVRHARYRWDEIRQQHQLVFPEGVLVLNESGAAIAKSCDGRSTNDLIAALQNQFTEGNPAGDVHAFLSRLFEKGLVCDAGE